MTTVKAFNGKSYAGNPHVRFDEREAAPAKLRRGSLLYKNENVRETLWVYYKYSTKTTRATLRQYSGGKLQYVDDPVTTGLAAATLKAWVVSKGVLTYPDLLVLPRGVYIADGSGSGLAGEDAERDVSYHLVDDAHARRILQYNGNTAWQTAKEAIQRGCHNLWSKLCRCFRKRKPSMQTEDFPESDFSLNLP